MVRCYLLASARKENECTKQQNVVNRWHYNGDQSATNPFLGHALERSWAEIMGCLDGGIADRCKDDVFDAELCQVGFHRFLHIHWEPLLMIGAQCFDDVDLP